MVKVPLAYSLVLLLLSFQPSSAARGLDKKARQEIIKGGSARAVAQSVLYPVDALRTLAQTRDGRTLADVGAKSLVRGCFTTSTFAYFQGAIQFGIFGALKRNSNCGPVVSSAVCAAASCLVSVPQEVIKQRLVTGVYGNFRDAMQSIYKSEGIRGFYSAWKPTMLRNVPFVVTTFTSMDLMKQYLVKDRTNKELDLFENLGVGMVSAFFGGIVTNPVDVVKTRMMTQAASLQMPYKNAWDCVVTTFQTEGVTSFYAGFQHRSVYMCGLWGITFALNGYFTKRLEQQQQQQQQHQHQNNNNVGNTLNKN